MRGSEVLVQEVYETLKVEARRLLSDRPTEALHPTELVHEAWARLAKHRFESEKHYKAVAALAMMHILTDHARARHSAKRKGEHVTLSALPEEHLNLDLLALHEALTKLRDLDERSYEVVILRYLGGMSAEEVAEWMGLSRRTVQNVWRLARIWLLEQLQ